MKDCFGCTGATSEGKMLGTGSLFSSLSLSPSFPKSSGSLMVAMFRIRPMQRWHFAVLPIVYLIFSDCNQTVMIHAELYPECNTKMISHVYEINFFIHSATH